MPKKKHSAEQIIYQLREAEVMGFPAGREYGVKTTRINEQWQSAASYFFVVGWGWYYLISVLDDYSRFILAWDWKADMTAQSISEPVQQAARGKSQTATASKRGKGKHLAKGKIKKAGSR